MNPGADLLPLAAALLARRGPGAVAVCALAPGDDLASRLAARLGATARIFSHPIIAHPEPTDFSAGADIPVSLGPSDEDQELPRRQVWPCGGLTVRLRRRRIDTAYGADPLGLIVLADPTQAVPVLLGAARTLAVARPAVLLRRADPAPADHRALRALMPTHDWFDCGALGQCALPRSEALPAFEPAAAARETTVAFDTQLTCQGFHAPEPDAPAGGRWTGAGLDSWFVMPLPAAGAWRLRLDVADWGNAAAGFPALVAGTRLAPLLLDPDGITYALSLPRAATGSTLTVTLLPPRPIPDVDRWPRKIGLRLRAATLRRRS